MSTDRSLSCPQCGRRYAEPADRCAADGSPLYGPEVLERLGMRINNYEIHSILGEGGMGIVYKGEHAMLGKPVAIKILHERFARREGATEQFLREARAASQVRHPNIVDVTDFGETADNSVYFVMEYLEGESLEDVLGRDHHIELFNTVNVVRQVGHALAAAHDHGVIHLDLKPENIFLINREGRRRIVRRVDKSLNKSQDSQRFVVEKEGTFDFVKLLDFGVAKFTQDSLGPGLGTRSGMVFGTPHYMSPEQARGESVDCRSDIYSLGVLFYEMILGEVPFEGEVALDVLNAHVSEAPIPPSQRSTIHVDPGTDRTIMRCLEKDPEARFQTMDELIEALLDCFTDRVYLRDVERLPGAITSGIAAPVLRETPTPEIAEDLPQEHQRKASLTDDLSELFGHEQPEAERAPAGVESEKDPFRHTPTSNFGDEKYVTPSMQRDDSTNEFIPASQPAQSRRRTNPGLGNGERKRKATAPLGSGSGSDHAHRDPGRQPKPRGRG
ncbi:MAG: serine/threonine protein kinase [Deltaproteobacteria bacterium]|nr:serine/threonine protein kinase [Deltaproteobacteria bacterium]